MGSKYDTVGWTADVLVGLPSVAEVVHPDPESFDTTYVDTADLRLLKAGISVGRATGSWRTIVATNGGKSREIEFVSTNSAQSVPDELSSLLLGYTGGRELRPCAHVAVQRDRWRLVDRDDIELAEVVGHTVSGRDLRRTAASVETWQEFEVEVREGKPGLEKRAFKRLGEARGRRRSERATIARVLGSQEPDSESDRPDSRSAARVLHCYLRAQIAALRAADLALRLDEPDALHDVRVSVRRLRSCLRVFRKIFDPAGIHVVATELAWLSDLLGSARDVEVLRQRIGAALHDLPDELVLGPVWVELDRFLARGEADAQAEVHASINGARYRRLLDALDGLLDDRPYRAHHGVSARKLLRRQVRKAARKVMAAVDEATTTQGQDHTRALHNVRKKVKRLRYACEAAEPALGKHAQKVRRWTKRIQRTLGDHHDGFEMRAALRELGARAQVDGGNGFTFGLLYGQLDERAAPQEHAFGEQWRRLTESKPFRRLG